MPFSVIEEVPQSVTLEPFGRPNKGQIDLPFNRIFVSN
jgi:hypothetical protein